MTLKLYLTWFSTVDVVIANQDPDCWARLDGWSPDCERTCGFGTLWPSLQPNHHHTIGPRGGLLDINIGSVGLKEISLHMYMHDESRVTL